MVKKIIKANLSSINLVAFNFAFLVALGILGCNVKIGSPLIRKLASLGTSQNKSAKLVAGNKE
ncbi:MAG: hypothetical protein ABIK73_08430 [candidate division WOR-3 bacterium]